ncbi:hypothetical protein BDV3_007297 [Batrachochytrium dendrobatidis]
MTDRNALIKTENLRLMNSIICIETQKKKQSSLPANGNSRFQINHAKEMRKLQHENNQLVKRLESASSKSEYSRIKLGNEWAKTQEIRTRISAHIPSRSCIQTPHIAAAAENTIQYTKRLNTPKYVFNVIPDSDDMSINTSTISTDTLENPIDDYLADGFEALDLESECKSDTYPCKGYKIEPEKSLLQWYMPKRYAKPPLFSTPINRSSTTKPIGTNIRVKAVQQLNAATGDVHAFLGIHTACNNSVLRKTAIKKQTTFVIPAAPNQSFATQTATIKTSLPVKVVSESMWR